MSQSKRPTAEEIVTPMDDAGRVCIKAPGGISYWVRVEEFNQHTVTTQLRMVIEDVIKSSYQAGRDDEKKKTLRMEFDQRLERYDRQEFIDKYVLALASNPEATNARGECGGNIRSLSDDFEEAGKAWDERERRRKDEGAKNGRSNAEIAEQIIRDLGPSLHDSRQAAVAYIVKILDGAAL